MILIQEETKIQIADVEEINASILERLPYLKAFNKINPYLLHPFLYLKELRKEDNEKKLQKHNQRDFIIFFQYFVSPWT